MDTVLKGHELAQALERIGAIPSLLSDGRACLASTVGGYRENCESQAFWRLLSARSLLPWFLAPLARITGSRRCLVQFGDGRGVPAFANVAADYPVEVYSCSEPLVAVILQQARKPRGGGFHGIAEVVKTDPTHMLWQHFAESEQWCYVTAECGAACASDLVSLVAEIANW